MMYQFLDIRQRTLTVFAFGKQKQFLKTSICSNLMTDSMKLLHNSILELSRSVVGQCFDRIHCTYDKAQSTFHNLGNSPRIINVQICDVLYPGDATENGKLLRLKQQYFLCSASLQVSCYSPIVCVCVCVFLHSPILLRARISVVTRYVLFNMYFYMPLLMSMATMLVPRERRI